MQRIVVGRRRVGDERRGGGRDGRCGVGHAAILARGRGRDRGQSRALCRRFTGRADAVGPRVHDALRLGGWVGVRRWR